MLPVHYHKQSCCCTRRAPHPLAPRLTTTHCGQKRSPETKDTLAMADAPKPVVVNAPKPQRLESSGSGSSGDFDHDGPLGAADMNHGEFNFAAPVQAANGVVVDDDIAPLREPAYSWSTAAPPPLSSSLSSSSSSSRPRGPQIMTDVSPAPQPNGTNGLTSSARGQRPSAVRTPSNAYAPARRPPQFSLNSTTSHRQRNNSATRSRRNPNAEYRAQEKAYVQRIRQEDQQDDFFDPALRTPCLG